MAEKKRASISDRAGEEAEKKSLTGKVKKSYVGGAYNRARLEKAKKAPATPATRKAYTKPSLRATSHAEHEREKEHHSAAYEKALNDHHKEQMKDVKDTRHTAAKKILEHIQSQPSALTGSEKQVEWATKIRAAYLAKMASKATHYAQRYALDGSEVDKTRLQHLAEERDHTQAAWWINHRDGLK